MEDNFKINKTRLPAFTIAENEFLLNHERIVDFFKLNKKKQQVEIAKLIENDMIKVFGDSARDYVEVNN